MSKKADFQLKHSYSTAKGALLKRVLMLTLSALLFENGLPNLPVLLVEPHRNRRGLWCIKLTFGAGEPLSMSAVQASTMVSELH